MRREKKPNFNFNRRLSRKELLLIAAAALSLLIVAFSFQQCRLLAMGVIPNEIVSVQLVEYRDRPFESDVISVQTLSSNSEAAAALRHGITMQDITFFHPQYTSRVLFIGYADHTLNAYVANGKIGLNYGAVWIDVGGLEEILAKFELQSD